MAVLLDFKARSAIEFNLPPRSADARRIDGVFQALQPLHQDLVAAVLAHRDVHLFGQEADIDVAAFRKAKCGTGLGQQSSIVSPNRFQKHSFEMFAALRYSACPITISQRNCSR
jgi:hypothetical protein